MNIIKDLRTNTLYIDNNDFIRDFEKIIKRNISLSKAKELFPEATNLVSD